ncbi:MAG: hypothetical protein RL120_08855 [Gammaproteobacteria bacterium]
MREVSTPAWNISFQLAGVTHTESGISDDPLRAVFIQMKRPVAGTVASDSGLPRFPADGPLDRRRNERVRVWEYSEGASGNASAHYHAHDAVVVWFDSNNQPNVYFITRGSIHGSDVPTAEVRTFVFEIL